MNVKELVKKLTLEEKAGLFSGDDYWHLKGIERLNIPRLMVSDGPHGLRKQNKREGYLGVNESIKAVCFPTACASASSYDEELLEEMGDFLGQECRAEEVGVLLGPAINIKRVPLCGRNFEYFSEDPYLAGKLGAAQVKGIQKWDIGTSVKHFAANNQEFKRMTVNTLIKERAFREIYLRAFEIIVKEAKPWTLMCSYNKINGVYSSDNEYLLQTILRDEWGFEGFVMSDWGAVNDRPIGVKAGLDLEMPKPVEDKGMKAILKAYEEGYLTDEDLDRGAERILNIVLKYTESELEKPDFDLEKHHLKAIEMAEGCPVLLKNEDNVLPLDKEKKIAYIGEYAKKPRFQGGGSSHVNCYKVESVLDANPNAIYAKGFPGAGDVKDEKDFAEAIKIAKEADVAVVFAGLPDVYESESYDRAHMDLPKVQNELIQEITKVQKNVVVVLHLGSPVTMPWINDVKGVLCLYLNGQGVGKATDSILYGKVSPSGKLAETWPIRFEDTPCYLNYPGNGKEVEYTEGVFVGYRYYEKKKLDVLFPFGHGLSYSAFEYSNLKLSSDKMNDESEIEVSVDIKNIGKMDAKEVVQLYIADKTGTPERPLKELQGFKKISLKKGETKTVKFLINKRSLTYYREDMREWWAKSGEYEVLIAAASNDIRLSKRFNYKTNVYPKFIIDQNTTIQDLLDDDRTDSYLNSVMDVLQREMNSRERSKEEDEAINPEMQRLNFLAAPIRSIRSFTGVTEEELSTIVKNLAELVK